jgi:hypothetical protein
VDVMNLRLAISGAIWAAIIAIAVQLVPSPALAHAGHTHHAGDVTTLHQSSDALATIHKAAKRTANPVSQPAFLSSAPAVDDSIALTGACTGSCCGAGTGCCGVAMPGSIADIPRPGAATQLVALASHRRSGIDPDGLARPPRSLAL